jgi:hypothetical protein
MTITMVVMAVAMAVKTSMDAKRQAALSRKNAIAQQKVEQEALLKKRAEQGDEGTGSTGRLREHLSSQG